MNIHGEDYIKYIISRKFMYMTHILEEISEIFMIYLSVRRKYVIT